MQSPRSVKSEAWQGCRAYDSPVTKKSTGQHEKKSNLKQTQDVGDIQNTLDACNASVERNVFGFMVNEFIQAVLQQSTKNKNHAKISLFGGIF